MRLWKERAGVISEGPCWVFMQECWLYTSTNMFNLIWIVATQWHSDRHLVG